MSARKPQAWSWRDDEFCIPLCQQSKRVGISLKILKILLPYTALPVHIGLVLIVLCWGALPGRYCLSLRSRSSGLTWLLTGCLQWRSPWKPPDRGLMKQRPTKIKRSAGFLRKMIVATSLDWRRYMIAIQVLWVLDSGSSTTGVLPSKRSKLWSLPWWLFLPDVQRL